MLPPPGPSAADFADTLSRAVSRRGLTLENLSQQLRDQGRPVSISTLSCWQTGRSIPSRANSIKAVESLEGLLGLPEGMLIRALPGGGEQRWDPLRNLPQQEQVDKALAMLGLAGVENYETRYLEQSSANSRRTNRSIERSVHLLQCTEGELSRFPLVFGSDAVDPTAPWVEATAGCHVGEVAQLGERTTIVEMVLDHPMAAGDLRLVEYEVHWDHTSGEDNEMSRTIPDTLDYLVMTATFTDELPHTVQSFHVPRTSDSHRAQDRTEDHLTPQRQVQFVVTNPRPGATGLVWEF